MFHGILTCGSIFGPVDTLGQWPFGNRGDHEEDTIYRRADGQDPARGPDKAGRHLVAELTFNRQILFQAAGSGIMNGSGGEMWSVPTLSQSARVGGANHAQF
jgi:hypothetical protein